MAHSRLSKSRVFHKQIYGLLAFYPWLTFSILQVLWTLLARFRAIQDSLFIVWRSF